MYPVDRGYVNLLNELHDLFRFVLLHEMRALFVTAQYRFDNTETARTLLYLHIFTCSVMVIGHHQCLMPLFSRSAWAGLFPQLNTFTSVATRSVGAICF